MSLKISLLTSIFTQCMCTLDALFLPLAAAQPVLMRHRGHQVDKHVIDGSYHGAGDRITWPLHFQEWHSAWVIYWRRSALQ